MGSRDQRAAPHDNPGRARTIKTMYGESFFQLSFGASHVGDRGETAGGAYRTKKSGVGGGGKVQLGFFLVSHFSV